MESRLALLGIAVAVSCVDLTLPASVDAAFADVRPKEGTIISAGYDGLNDAFTLRGIDPDELVRAIETATPCAGSFALAAIANGTFRIDPALMFRSE